MIAVWIILGLVLTIASVLISAGMYFYRHAIHKKTISSMWHDSLEDLPEIQRLDVEKDLKDEKKGEILVKELEWIKAMPREHMEITSFDGVKLSGEYIRNANARAVVVMMHGWRGCGIHNFAHCVRVIYENGCSLLIPDQRAHGDSEGMCTTFGVFERYDTVKWVEAVNCREENRLPVMLYGISLGAATVLLASSLSKLPHNVCGVVGDCGFTAPKDIFREVMKKSMQPIFIPIVMTAGRLYIPLRTHCKMWSVSVPEEIKKCKIPVMLLHGDEDKFVPYEMSKRTLESAKAAGVECSLVTVSGAGHTECWSTDFDKCKSAFESFLDKCLNTENRK